MLSLKECIRIAEKELAPAKAQKYFEFQGGYFIQMQEPHVPMPTGTTNIWRVDRETGEMEDYRSLGKLEKIPGLLQAAREMKTVRSSIFQFFTK